MTKDGMKVKMAPVPRKRAIRINFTSGASFPFFPPILVARGIGSSYSLSLRSSTSSTTTLAAEGRERREKRRIINLTRRVQGVNEIILADLLTRIRARFEHPTETSAREGGGGGMMILTDYVKPSDGFTLLIIALNHIDL